MFELAQSDYMAAENCKAKGALATKGLGRSVPLEWEDASIVHESLKGVKMVTLQDSLYRLPSLLTYFGNSRRSRQTSPTSPGTIRR